MAKSKAAGNGGTQGGTSVATGPDDWRAIAANPAVAEAVREHFTYTDKKATARSKINADIASSRKGLEGRSLNPHAVKAMEQYYKGDATKRAGWIQTVLIIMAAKGDPLQQDMLMGMTDETSDSPPPVGDTGHDQAGVGVH